MKYRKLGNTGLIVSELALGTMQFGGRMNMGNLGREDTTRMVKAALDRGINFIDTADVYSLGESETLVGNALKGVRNEIVLATKVRLPMGENFNRSGATRVNIMREVEGSLRRWQGATAVMLQERLGLERYVTAQMYYSLVKTTSSPWTFGCRMTTSGNSTRRR